MKRFKKESFLNKTAVEDWSFELEVLSAGACRIGLETDDAFGCTTAARPASAPKTMGTLRALCEEARAGRDLRLLGGRSGNEIEFVCADGAVIFRVHAVHAGG